ncbi:MAG: flavodoxin family protein [Candidatus Heimdallarchaeaceae archaeon]
MTQVTIINGSPKLEKSNTSFVLAPFIKGLEEAGASVELIYAKKLKIRPCIGCFKCWRETIGECFQEDDMKELLAKFKETDILIIATPAYAPLPGELQNMLNRMVPLIDPLLVFREGRTRAKLHDDVKISKILGLIIGGWWELENLDTVAKIIEELTELYSLELTDPVLRPHANILRSETELNQEILKRFEKVGFDLIKKGKMDKSDLEFIRQPLIQQEDYLERSNKNYLRRKEEKK